MMTKKRATIMLKVLLLMTIGIAIICRAEDHVIRLNTASGAKADYVVSILKLAFAHTDKSYKIISDATPSTQSRIEEEMKSGNLDLMWASTNKEKENEFLPIRIPLLKGLLGYRLLLIRSDDQAKFDKIFTLNDFKDITLGQGRTWADTKILEENQLKVIKTSKIPSLFHMLDGGRFDAFPRGASEPFVEVKKYPSLRLKVEDNLVLQYTMPFYLFVNKGNKNLARDLELGLNRAIEDGSFEEVFLKNPTVKDMLEQARLNQRRVIHLDNPTLPIETPLDRANLWIDLSSL